jgi:release factor glutamine methyltransferase
MSAEDAERIRRWHERSYAEARHEGAEGQVFEYLGRTITVPPDVQPITRMSHLLGQAVLDEVRPGDRVLDMGTGSGVNAILAAPTAARANAAANGVAVDVRESDVFGAVDASST